MSKIIIFGDSIAYGKWDTEGGWVARIRKQIDENFNIGKGGNFQVYNESIPGDVIPRIVERIDQELSMRLPAPETDKRNVVIIAAGINDSCPNNWMTLKQTPENEFKNSFRRLITTAQKQQCHLGVIGLTPVNPSKSTGLLFSDEEVKRYDEYITSVCQELSIPKLQLFQDLQAMKFSELLVDVVHPNDKGHEILAERIYKFINDNFISYPTQ